MSMLRAVTRIETAPATFVRECSTVLLQFDHLTQDSGNVSWLVESEGERLFVKSAGVPGPPVAGAPVPYFDHAGRVRLLRNAAELARSCDHPALPTLLNVIESPVGPALVYEAAPGDLIRVPSDQRDAPESAYQRLAHLPAPAMFTVFDALIDVHADLAAAGWVAGDLYDGCLIVDFPSASLTVIDLDSYRRGPTTNDMGRMFGSSRFMAPEEHELGARIDQRTTVFTLGRIVWHFTTRLTEDSADFCGTAGLAQVLQKACEPVPADRFASVADLARAWRRSRCDRPAGWAP
ncbi:MAG TPA: serine/threonine-protein kinase [Nocardioidaceae bacterium]|jgi:serine/threonine-protein kinase|nr:serine/threonine-protein kinase [Nocardioidaceae bacterium]